MKKNLTIIFWIIVIIVSFYFVYKNWNKQQEEIKIDRIQTTNEGEKLVVANSLKTIVLNPSNDHVKFDVKYPSFKYTSDDFNTSIETLVKNQMADHVQISIENWQARYETQVEGENIPKTPIREDDKFSFFVDFEIAQSNSSYISFVLKYGGFSGGAHGYEDNISFNYDVKDQKIIGLKDLFPGDPKYLTTISTKSREYLKKQFATVSNEDKENSSEEAVKEYIKNMEDMIEVGTEPKEENFSVFTFTGDKIKIYFAQYQVGPYVIGMPEVEIDRK